MLAWREAQTLTFADTFLALMVCLAIATVMVPLMRKVEPAQGASGRWALAISQARGGRAEQGTDGSERGNLVGDVRLVQIDQALAQRGDAYEDSPLWVNRVGRVSALLLPLADLLISQYDT